MGTIIEITFIITIVFILIINLYMMYLNKKLGSVNNERELSGFEIAKIISSKIADKEPHIIKKKGKFLDHYNINRNVIKLSPEVFDGTDLYAGFMAIITALESDKNKINIVKGHNSSSLITVASYLVIILGAFLNNSDVIYLGIILFIISLILELLILKLIFKNKDNIEKVYKLIEEENIINPFEQYKKHLMSLFLVYVAKIPYSFINNFR